MKLMQLLAVGAIVLTAPAALADKKSEAYVEAQANAVLKVLNDKTLTSDERSAKFADYMHKFAYMPDIARRVLGAQGRSLSEAQFDRYYKTFEEYATEVYQAQLDEFRGESIKVVGSTDPAPRRSQVNTLIKSTESGKDIQVVWDVLQSKDGQTYRVRDVGINLDGSVIWLAQDQQAQFESFLDRNNGDIDKLIDRIKQMIADMRERAKAGAASTLAKSTSKNPG
ncbi:MAG: ABC transporter substrate-binding protein [Alphaproteobacteria bacterium]|nr:ABC transporter substrate-binding protein [Alphaproteobacteria bacterium]